MGGLDISARNCYTVSVEKKREADMEIELGEYEVLEDMLIGGLKIVQDTRLYRFTSDSVFLSRFAMRL